MGISPARHAPHTPTERSLAPDRSDVTSAIHNCQGANSGRCASIVMLCIHFLACLYAYLIFHIIHSMSTSSFLI